MKQVGIADGILIGLFFVEKIPVKNIYKFVPNKYKKSNLVSLISRLNKENLIIKNNINIVSTDKGNNFIKNKFKNLNGIDSKWDGKWRIVMFDIPEVDRNLRDNLRDFLINLKFAMVQQSVWVGAKNYDDKLSNYIKEKGISKYINLFLSSEISHNDNLAFAHKVWKLADINENYQSLISKFDYRLFLETVIMDPFLPSNLYPNNWPFEKVIFRLRQWCLDSK